jgi:D-sedoheptulose 7-phosphate isomerase
VTTVGFTGDGNREMSAYCNLCLAAPSSETPLIQQVHIVVAHAICGLVEQSLCGEGIAGVTAASPRAEI